MKIIPWRPILLKRGIYEKSLTRIIEYIQSRKLKMINLSDKWIIKAFRYDDEFAFNKSILSLFIFFIFTAAFCYFQLVTVWLHHLDTAFMMEVIASIADTGKPYTYLGPSYIDAASTFKLDAKTVCESALMPGGRSLSVFESHAYYILYPLSLLTWLFEPHVIIAFVNGIAFSSVVFIAYWIVRKQGVPVIGAVSLSLLVLAHPAWSHASLGDIYADRFFMPFGLLYAYLLYEVVARKGNIGREYWALLLVVGLIASSMTERAAIMIASYTVAILVLYWKEFDKRNTKIYLILFVLALLIHVLVYVKYFHVYHQGTGSLGTLLEKIPRVIKWLESPSYVANLKEYIVINIILFGIFSLFNWRLALIAFAAMLPNFLTNVGGAEKTGWATHYHSMYFPFLVFATAMGFSKLWNNLRLVKYQLLLMVLLLALIPLISSYSKGYGDQKGAMKRMYEFYINGEQSYEKYVYGQFGKIADAIPKGATVATTERFMPLLYLDRVLYYYPVGIDIAEYVVLPVISHPDGTSYYPGVVNYIGEKKQADECLTERLKAAGFEFDKPVLLLPDSVVLKRSDI